jgi:hypothetical protein
MPEAADAPSPVAGVEQGHKTEKGGLNWPPAVISENEYTTIESWTQSFLHGLKTKWAR